MDGAWLFAIMVVPELPTIFKFPIKLLSIN